MVKLLILVLAVATAMPVEKSLSPSELSHTALDETTTDLPTTAEDAVVLEPVGVVVPANWPYYHNYYEGDIQALLAPEPLRAEADDMAVAENVVFRPLFRYRQQGAARRRIRNTNRRSYITKTYAKRYPYSSYSYPYNTRTKYA